MILLNICHAINNLDFFLQHNNALKNLDLVLNKVYQRTTKDENFLRSQKIWTLERDKIIASNHENKEKELKYMYHERIKYLLINATITDFIMKHFADIAAKDDLHSIDARILRYALRIFLGADSFSTSLDDDSYYRYIWKVKNNEYILMWTLDAGNKIGAHMFFYITLDTIVTAIPLTFRFHNHERAIHSFNNDPSFENNILTITDNRGKTYKYCLKERKLIPSISQKSN